MIGLSFNHAMGEEQVPPQASIALASTSFSMSHDSPIALSKCPQDEDEVFGRGAKAPNCFRHFAIAIEESENVLMKAKADLQAKGLNTVGPTNHDDFTESLYFFAPSSHRLKLTIRTYKQPRASRDLATK